MPLTKMANRQSGFNKTAFLDEESVCFAMPSRLGQMADLGNEPLTSDDEEACFEDVWIPKGVAKLRLESREISISLWKKHDVETDIRQKRSEFLLLGKEKWMVYCERLFCLCQRSWKVSKCFLLRMRKPRITFFLLFWSQKEKGKIEGVHPNKNWKQLK